MACACANLDADGRPDAAARLARSLVRRARDDRDRAVAWALLATPLAHSASPGALLACLTRMRAAAAAADLAGRPAAGLVNGVRLDLVALGLLPGAAACATVTRPSDGCAGEEIPEAAHVAAEEAVRAAVRAAEACGHAPTLAHTLLAAGRDPLLARACGAARCDALATRASAIAQAHGLAHCARLALAALGSDAARPAEVGPPTCATACRPVVFQRTPDPGAVEGPTLQAPPQKRSQFGADSDSSNESASFSSDSDSGLTALVR